MKKLTYLFCTAIFLFILMIAFSDTVTAAEKPSSAETKLCAGLNYQDDNCDCESGIECSNCPCASCSADKNCECIKKVRQTAGSISGTISVVRTKVKTKGVKSSKDVVVYLEQVGDNDFPDPERSAKMDQKGLVFIPHVLPIQRGTTVDFLNNDNDKHNVYFVNNETGDTEDIGTWMPGESKSRKFERSDAEDESSKTRNPETLISLCKLHLEMAAYVVVMENPFFVMTPIDGDSQKAQFTMKNIPPGEYSLNTWHKKLKLKGGSKKVIITAKETTTVNLEITKKKYAK